MEYAPFQILQQFTVIEETIQTLNFDEYLTKDNPGKNALVTLNKTRKAATNYSSEPSVNNLSTDSNEDKFLDYTFTKMSVKNGGYTHTAL